MPDRIYARFTEFFSAGAGIAGMLAGIGSIVVAIWLTKWTIRGGENNPPRTTARP
jgi:hypothetical protein